MEQTIRWVMADLYRRYRLDSVQFLGDDADYLVFVLEGDGYPFQVLSHDI